jgi:hypothetical protein
VGSSSHSIGENASYNKGDTNKLRKLASGENFFESIAVISISYYINLIFLFQI